MAKTPVKMPDNLPLAKKPVIVRPTPKTVPLPKPPFTPRPK